MMLPPRLSQMSSSILGPLYIHIFGGNALLSPFLKPRYGLVGRTEAGRGGERASDLAEISAVGFCGSFAWVFSGPNLINLFILKFTRYR